MAKPNINIIDFEILYNIFTKEDHISNNNQMKFENCIKITHLLKVFKNKHFYII